MSRLVCIVEGAGDADSIPTLCAMILKANAIWNWHVDSMAIRQPRSRLVNEQEKSPIRSVTTDGVERAIRLAIGRPADAVVVVCDSDDDCPAVWGASAHEYFTKRGVRGGAVMAVREYEAWILHNYSDEVLAQNGIRNIDELRGAKGALARIVRGYLPTLNQLPETKNLDIEKVAQRSPSFAKLVRTIRQICG